jgi:hypothetical protein
MQDAEVFIEQAGWPLRTVKSTRFEAFEGSSRIWQPRTRYRFASWQIGIVRETQFAAVTGSTGGTVVDYLPTAPIWTGLILNTAFYALAAWAPFLGFAAMRRYHRHRRGVCPYCAYPVATAPVCTECGRPVKRRTVVAA